MELRSLFGFFTRMLLTLAGLLALAACTTPTPGPGPTETVQAQPAATRTTAPTLTPEPTPTRGVSSLEGKVTWAPGGEPFVGARVVVGEEMTTLSDEQGRFSLEGIPAGFHDVAVLIELGDPAAPCPSASVVTPEVGSWVIQAGANQAGRVVIRALWEGANFRVNDVLGLEFVVVCR